MKTSSFGKHLSLAVLSFCISPSVFAAVNPQSTKIKLYKFAVSASPLCTNPITVFSNNTPVDADLLALPTLGSGSLAAGTYPCVMLEISKSLSFSPATTESVCVAGTNYTIDICSANSVTLIDGTKITCSGGSANEQRVAIYLTTQCTGTNGQFAFRPPTSSTDTVSGIKLSAALVVTGDTSGTFVVDGRSKVKGLDDSGVPRSSCDMDPPLFGFR